METAFTLDPRIAETTHPIKIIAGFDVRLVNDDRWPWVMLVPCVPHAVGIIDLSEAQIRVMMKLARNTARILGEMYPGTRTNIATLGNVVSQFHLHVVARRAGDPNWPGPVWGFGQAVPYDEPDAWVARFHELHDVAVPELDRL